MLDMPRKVRIDAPGGLHHIIVRGINRKKICFDDADRDGFWTDLAVSCPIVKLPVLHGHLWEWGQA